MSRVDKWLIMVKEKEKWFYPESANYKKFSERVWKGIPGRVRGEAWLNLLNIEPLKKEHSGVYDKMRFVT